MVLISKLLIKDFRVIGELEYSPRQINIITGRNNTGKSALLDAIALNVTGYIHWDYQDIFFNSPIDFIKYGKQQTKIDSNVNSLTIYLDIGILRKYQPEIIPEIFDKLCENLKEGHFGPSHIKKIIENKNFQDEYIELVKEYFDFLTISSNFGYAICPYVKEKSGGIKQFSENLQKILQKFTGQISTSEIVRIGRFVLYRAMIPGQLYLYENTSRKPHKVIKISHSNKLEFKNISEEELIKLEDFIREHNLIKDLKRLSENDVVYKKDNKLITIPIASHGDGFIALLNTYRYLLDARGGILLIEEPENHLHPRYIDIFIENLFKYCPKLEVQVFITTHSYDLIQTALEYPVENDEKELLQISKMTWDGEKIEKFDYSVDEGLGAIKELYLDLRGT